MTDAAKDESHSQAIPEVVQDVRRLLKELQAIALPEGAVRDQLSNELRNNKGEVDAQGTRALLKGVAGFLGHLPTENEKYVRRLRGEDGKDIVAILTDIAINPPDLNVKLQELREALSVDGKPLLQTLQSSIAVTQQGVDGRTAGLSNENQGGVMPEDERPNQKSGRNWRNRAKQASGPVDDDAIRRSAQDGPYSFPDDQIAREARQYNADHHIQPDEVIKRQADQYDKDHKIDDEAISRSADRGFSKDDNGGFEASRPKQAEVAAYQELVDTLASKLDGALSSHVKLGAGPMRKA